MSEKSVPVFCRSVSQILQIIADSSSDKNQAPSHVESGSDYINSYYYINIVVSQRILLFVFLIQNYWVGFNFG